MGGQQTFGFSDLSFLAVLLWLRNWYELREQKKDSTEY